VPMIVWMSGGIRIRMRGAAVDAGNGERTEGAVP
jgi:hypothetical protein